MKKNSVVPGALIAVVVAVGALAGTAFYLIKHRNSRSAATAARLPAQSVGIVNVHMDVVRGFGPAVSIRNAILENRNGSTVAREATARYNEAVQRCGFDPWTSLTALTFAVDRSASEARNASAFLGYLDGRFSAEQARRCAEYLVSRQDNKVLVESRIGNDTVYSPAERGGQPTEREAAFHFMTDTVLAAPRPYMQTALGLAHGTTPGLASDSRLNVMMRSLAGQNMVEGVVDLQQLRTQNPQAANDLFDNLVRDNPSIPDLTLGRQLVTGGMALRVVNGGIVFESRGAFLSATVARPFTTAVQSLINARRGQATQLLDEVQRSLAPASLLGLLNADARRQLDDVNGGIDALRQVSNQVATRTDDVTTVVTLTINAQQVQALERAARAGGDLAQAMMSARRNRGGNPFPGMGSDDGRLEQAPPPDRAAPQATGDAAAPAR